MSRQSDFTNINLTIYVYTNNVRVVWGTFVLYCQAPSLCNYATVVLAGAIVVVIGAVAPRLVTALAKVWLTQVELLPDWMTTGAA